jgi:hypothetical protein
MTKRLRKVKKISPPNSWIVYELRKQTWQRTHHGGTDQDYESFIKNLVKELEI